MSILGEADVIRIARTRSAVVAVATATTALADARTRTAARFPNPTLGWARESLGSDSVGDQDVFSVTFPIDVARPLAARALVASDGAWEHAEASLTRAEATLAALLAYYDVVVAKRRTEILSLALTNLDEAARVLARKEAAGSASGYESTRLAIASELSRSHLAEAQGATEAATARLASLLNIPPDSLTVSTSLSLPSTQDEATLAQRDGASQQALRQARESERLADDAIERAKWAWIPTVELNAGVQHVGEPEDGYGYVVGVAFGLPIFDQAQGLRAEAEAKRTLSTARSEALSRAISGAVASELATFRAARHELDRFETQTSGQIEVLLAAAQSGYREGERSIVELLDAQRAQIDVAERRLTLLGTAKRAEARLRAAVGDLQ